LPRRDEGKSPGYSDSQLNIEIWSLLFSTGYICIQQIIQFWCQQLNSAAIKTDTFCVYPQGGVCVMFDIVWCGNLFFCPLYSGQQLQFTFRSICLSARSN
jgi:hypothetical protein